MAKVKIDIANNVVEYLQTIFQIPAGAVGVRCYRGEGNVSWKLKPSIMRGVRSDAENTIFSELMLEAPTEFGSDKSMLDKLVRAQHHGLPTRLLDVSLNPLVALYFACSEEEHHDKAGAVNIFEFVDERVKFADSDTVSLICNLARLSDAERKEIISANQAYHSSKGSDKQVALNAFRKLDSVERLVQFIRVEKPYFLNLVQPVDLFKYFFVYPIKNNRRVVAQSGAFIVAGLLKYGSPASSSGFTLRKIEIPAHKKGDILKELDIININLRTMFPEVESASKYIKKKWTSM